MVNRLNIVQYTTNPVGARREKLSIWQRIIKAIGFNVPQRYIVRRSIRCTSIGHAGDWVAPNLDRILSAEFVDRHGVTTEIIRGGKLINGQVIVNKVTKACKPLIYNAIKKRKKKLWRFV